MCLFLSYIIVCILSINLMRVYIRNPVIIDLVNFVHMQAVYFYFLVTFIYVYFTLNLETLKLINHAYDLFQLIQGLLQVHPPKAIQLPSQEASSKA